MLIPGLVSITFRPLTPATIIALCQRTGLRGIEWGGDVHVPHGDLVQARAVRAQTADAGLTVAAYGSYYRAGSSEAAGLSFQAVLDSAHELGAPVIRVWAGKLGSAEATGEQRAAIIDDLARIAALAQAAGIDIALEYHANTLTDTQASTLALLQALPLSNLYTYWQPRNGEATDLAVAGLPELVARLRHVHVFHWWPTAHHRLPLAEGESRWAAFLAVLKPLPGQRFAMLEFVRDDTVAQAEADAATLLRWLA